MKKGGSGKEGGKGGGERGGGGDHKCKIYRRDSPTAAYY